MLGIHCALLCYLTLWIFTADAAYRDPSCPSMCRCLLFDGLRSVYCNRTGITRIPSGIPPDTQLLELSGNNLGHIRSDDLRGLTSLQQLYLYSAALVDGSIERGALDLPSLTSLELSDNGFTTVPQTLPVVVQMLWFMNNHMTVIQTDSLSRYTSLVYLDVSNNNLTTIQPGSFDALGNLSTLYLSFNDLTDASFPPNFLAHNQKLSTLSVRFNKLSSLLRNLPTSLENLDYVGNKIETLPAYGFQSLPNLQTLAFWEGPVLGFMS